jgi:hypothetical protein
MSLTTVPPARLLPEPGQPFIIYAIWPLDAYTVNGRQGLNQTWVLSAANLPGGPLAEFAVGGALAEVLAQVEPAELPIAVTLRLHVPTSGAPSEWRFDYLGQSDAFAQIWQVPSAVQPNGPEPLTLEQLNQGAEEMVRESLGIPPGESIPEPGGQLPAEEANEEPYRFDPARHMDLSMAAPAPLLPPPAPEGAPPPVGAQEFFAPPLPVGQDKRHGAYGDESIPFAH